ncbi:MAG: hypothetical protein ACFFCD_09460 [Promethearchaeota archaeon]
MGEIKEKDSKKIKTMMEEEFPHDPALQEVHIARKIIAKESELRGMSFLEYIKSLKSIFEKQLRTMVHNEVLSKVEFVLN